MDKTLKRAIKLALEIGNGVPDGLFGLLTLAAGTQAASNFRPGFACYLYRKYCEPGSVVLDTSTGYGGRLVGAIASGVVSKYIGIDPNTDTHEGNLKLSKRPCAIYRGRPTQPSCRRRKHKRFL